MKGSESVVAGKEKLRPSDLLGQTECLIRRECEGVVAVALVDLTEDDQWHRQMIEQTQPTVEVDGRLRCLDAFRFAPVRQRAIGKIRIEPRLLAEIAHRN
jgi:hypothetical protein